MSLSSAIVMDTLQRGGAVLWLHLTCLRRQLISAGAVYLCSPQRQYKTHQVEFRMESLEA